MQSALRLIYPPLCPGCGAPVAQDSGLCASCWAQTPFITGHACDRCGVPLPGDDMGHSDLCDDCLRLDPPWRRGRAALLYQGNARRMVLALKHGGKLELVPHMARWMLRAGGDVLDEAVLIVPVPIHWTRLAQRRFNQSAELARRIARLSGADAAPLALTRIRRTKVQDGLGVEARFANQAGAIHAHPRHGAAFKGRDICLIDDVMTSGATLAAATDACHAAGAATVCILVLARVAKDP